MSDINPNDTREVLTLLGRIDERTRIQAQEAIETRQAIARLPDIFVTRREYSVQRWIVGILLVAIVGAVITIIVNGVTP